MAQNTIVIGSGSKPKDAASKEATSQQTSDESHHSQMTHHPKSFDLAKQKGKEVLASTSNQPPTRSDGNRLKELPKMLKKQITDDYETTIAYRGESVLSRISNPKESKSICCVTVVDLNKGILTIKPVYSGKDVVFEKRGALSLSAPDMHWHDFCMIKKECESDAQIKSICLDPLHLDSANISELPKEAQIGPEHLLYEEITQNPHYKDVEKMLEEYASHLEIGNKMKTKVEEKQKGRVKVTLEINEKRA